MIRDRAVEPLFKLAKQPKQIIWTDGGHGFMTEDHRAAILQWLREGVPRIPLNIMTDLKISYLSNHTPGPRTPLARSSGPPGPPLRPA